MNLMEFPPDDLGFILLRNVRDQKTSEYWKLSYTCIRKFYPNNYIIIIDDNSDYDLIDLTFQKKIQNARVIRSEYPARGEILPYYYYLQNKLFNRAMIVHDSVFINSKLDTTVSTYKFLLEFTCSTSVYKNEELAMIKALNNNKNLLEYYNNRVSWKGCFGVMTIITYDFLRSINNQYNLFKLFPLIKTRRARICFEMVFACILQENHATTPLLGNIKHYCKWGIKYEDIKKYINDLSEIKLPLIKVWTGR